MVKAVIVSVHGNIVLQREGGEGRRGRRRRRGRRGKRRKEREEKGESEGKVTEKESERGKRREEEDGEEERQVEGEKDRMQEKTNLYLELRGLDKGRWDTLGSEGKSLERRGSRRGLRHTSQRSTRSQH